MKKSTLLLTFATAILLLSFTKQQTRMRERPLKPGTYGVCDCGNDADISKLGLTLNADSTFHYFNYSSDSEKIDIWGTWKKNKSLITLSGYSSQLPLDNKWKVDNNCLKSRKGLTFTKLCQQ